MFKDPLVRRFISASFFAAAFVWVAVSYFNVEASLAWNLFLLSIGFVLLLIVVGLLLAPLARLLHRKPTFLSEMKAPGRRGEADHGAERKEESD